MLARSACKAASQSCCDPGGHPAMRVIYIVFAVFLMALMATPGKAVEQNER